MGTAERRITMADPMKRAVLGLAGLSRTQCGRRMVRKSWAVGPSRKQGYGPMVVMWVTKEQFDKVFERELLSAVEVAFIGRAVPESRPSPGGIVQEQYNALPDKLE